MSMASLPRSPTSQRSCQAPRAARTPVRAPWEKLMKKGSEHAHTGIPSLLLGVWGR